MPRDSYHHGNLKSAALTAAETLIEQDPALSLRGLAGTLGVAHRALYNHFGDRAGFLVELAARGFDALATRTGTAATPTGFVTVYASFALQRPQLYRLMMGQSYAAFENHPALRQATDRLITAALRILSPDSATADAGRRAVMRIWMLVHGGLALHSGGVLRTRSDADFVAELLAVAGLAAAPDEIVQPLWPKETRP